MTQDVHIAGDGVAGLALARRLAATGLRPVVHGDGAAGAGTHALVHRYAGRSFRTSALEDAAWGFARPWLEELVAAGAARSIRMLRPLGSPAGARLAGSVEHAEGVTTEVVAPFGECFVYGPAFVVDVAAALMVLGTGVERIEARTARRDAIWAVGADVALPHVDRYGGHVIEFVGTLADAVSGGGIHAVPTANGVSVGATFWPEHEPLGEAEAVADLQARAERLGVPVGEVLRVWRGMRAVNNLDRAPVVGEVDGRFVVAALGTRGWFWAALLAEVATAAIVDGAPVPAELSVARLLDRT